MTNPGIPQANYHLTFLQKGALAPSEYSVSIVSYIRG